MKRRLTVTAPNKFCWEEVNLLPPGPAEVLVRTRLSAVSVASELSVMRDGPFPARLGYQTLGVLEAVGAAVELEAGQRVFTALGHASAGIHRAGKVIPVPDHIPDRQALAVLLGEETHKGVRKVAPQPQERVLVAGAGLLGLLSVFNLTRRGIEKVTVLEPDAERRELALAFGAASACASGHLPHDAYDLGLECSASPAGFVELLSHLKPGGRCCVLSDGNWGALTLPPAFHTRELSVVASSDGEDYATYAGWLWEHADPVLERLFAETITPDDLPATFARLRQPPRPVSVVVDWTA
ncbi:zinc-dependent alcohol dehydrogenase [Deinococcus frigens]|uniref:zinc-dependent alcohol dehydrogenase n=1 Tax=Deinococcus frigens TaxID=249403 RepID=UPI00049807B1|nr:zinc-binding alcohol dehydrogenase [Deinococcus frigens]